MNKTSSFRPPSVHLTAKEEISLEGKNSSLILDNETHFKSSKVSELGIPVPVMYQERMMPITKKYNSSKKKQKKKEEEKNFVLDLLGYYDAKKIVEDVKEGEVGLDTVIAGASFTPPGKAAKAIKTGGKGIKKVWNKMTGKDKKGNKKSNSSIGKNILNMTVDEARKAVESKLKNGKITIKELKEMIPSNVKNTFVPNIRIKEGKKYIFKLWDGKNAIIRWHEPDSEVATKFPNSPSGKGWTAQIRIGNKSLGSDGKWYKNQNKDVVHIPIIGGGE